MLTHACLDENIIFCVFLRKGLGTHHGKKYLPLVTKKNHNKHTFDMKHFYEILPSSKSCICYILFEGTKTKNLKESE